MQLNADQLRDVYDAMIRPIGHPDPIGFIARGLLLTEGDPDYIDINGKQGFIPIDPGQAMQELGSMDVQSLEGNISTAMAMDIQNLERLGSLEEAIIATHDGADANGVASEETRQMLADLPEAREEVHLLLFPRLATVEDVIGLLRASETSKPSKTRMSFFKELVNGQS